MMRETPLISWHAQDASEALQVFDSSKEGLSEEQVRVHLEEYGPNRTHTQQKRMVFWIFLSQFRSPFMLILIGACLVSVVLREWLDVGVILAAIVANVSLGFLEEYKADRTLAKLLAFLPEEARVRREGRVVMIPAEEVVPGDILLFRSGDKVIADARLLTVEVFEVNEAVLTGESAFVRKQVEVVEVRASTGDRLNMVFAGTTIVNGSAEAVVVATGLQTEIGKITGLVKDAEQVATPLQKQLQGLAHIIAGVVLLTTFGIFLLGLARGVDVAEIFSVAVALAVSAVPEGLVVAMTVILAVGMQRILKRQALVRRLVASETLGSVSVICVDKTGTLTTGEMSVDVLGLGGKDVAVDASGDEVFALKRAAASALFVSVLHDEDGAVRFEGAPTELAFARYLKDDFSVGQWDGAQLAALPFDSTNKFSARVLQDDRGIVLYALGAPDVLLERCDISDVDRRAFYAHLERLTEQGHRVLFVAQKTVSVVREVRAEDVRDMKPVGFFGLRDPLREEVKVAIAEAKQAGLIPVMLTGDHQATAFRIAVESGLAQASSEVVTGLELEEMSDQELAGRVAQIRVYARVSPAHKLRIVRAWQSRGYAVAMTGDGVNDAPAIKVADIGIAVGSGTEVSKEAADMVLLNNSFATIIAAIYEGRVIFENIRKVVVYLLADSFSAVVLVGGALALGLPLPLLPAHILWINFITDGFPAMALTFEPGERSVMKDPPRKKSEPILNGEMKVLIFAVSAVTDVLLFGVFFLLLRADWPMEKIRTLLFLKLGFSTLLYIFAVRSLRKSAFSISFFSNKWLLLAIGVGILLQIAPVAIPRLRELFEFSLLSPSEWLFILALASLNFFMIEGVKLLYRFKS